MRADVSSQFWTNKDLILSKFLIYMDK